MTMELYPMLLVAYEGRTLTWRFEAEDSALKARTLLRMKRVPFVERWGALPLNAAFTRRSEYEAVIRAWGQI